MVAVTFQTQHQRNRHHIHLAANRVRELVQRKQRGQRRVGEGLATRHRDDAPLEVMGSLHRLAGADEALSSRIDGGINGIDRIGAHVHDILVPQIDQMLGGGEHAVLIVDGDGGVEAALRRRIDADDRHVDAFELLDFLRIHAERRYEYGVHVAADGQIREEFLAILGRVDMLEQRYVIPGIMHDGFDSSEHFRIEPASDLFIHQHRHTVRLTRFQRCRGT